MNNQLNNDQDGKRPDNKDPRQGSGKNHQSILAFLICLLVTLVCFALFTNMLKDNSSEISYDKFIDMVDKDQVKEVTIQSSTLTIVPKKKNSKYEDMSYYTTKTEDSTALTKRLEGKGIKFETDPPDVFGEFVAMILSVVLPTLLLFGLLMFSMRRMNKGGGIMGMGVGTRAKPRHMCSRKRAFPLRMWQVRMKPRNLSRKLWIFFTTPENTQPSEPSCLRAHFL